MALTVHVEYMDQHGYWKHYGTYHHHQNAYRTAEGLAKRNGKRHRLVDGDGALLDLIYP